MNSHVLLSYDADGRQDLDYLGHHAGLFGINGSGEEQETPFIAKNPLQAILQEKTNVHIWPRSGHSLILFTESIEIHRGLKLTSVLQTERERELVTMIN